MIIEGGQGESQGRFNRTYDIFAGSAWLPTVTKSDSSRRVSAQEAAFLSSSSGWMGSLFIAPHQMIEAFLTSMVRGLGSMTSTMTLKSQ